MYSWIFGDYFYKNDLIKMIDEIDKKRKDKRLKGLLMNSTFADDLKNSLNGIEEIVDMEEENNKKSNSSKTSDLPKTSKIIKSSSDSIILYDNNYKHKPDPSNSENLKMTIENQ